MRLLNKNDLVQWCKNNWFYFLLMVPFGVYIFMRSDLLYFDAYHIACLSCGCDEPKNPAPLANIFFPLLPCSLLLFKLLMFLCMALSVFFLEKTRKGAGVMAFLFPVFLLEFLRWENELFAYVLLFAATYFLFQAYKKRFWLNQGISALLVLLACGFWIGAVFYPFVVLLKKKAWVMRCLAVAFALLFGSQLWSWFFSSFALPDNEVIAGLGVIWLLPGLFIALIGLPLRRWRHPAWLALVLAYLKAQLIVYSMVFLPLGVVHFVKRHPSKARLLKITAVALLLIGSFHILLQNPRADVHSAVDYALELSADNEICNDWDIGYIIKWHGGIPERDSGHRDESISCEGITVSRKNPDCEMVKDFGHYAVYNC